MSFLSKSFLSEVLTLKRQYFFNWFHKTLKFSSHPEMALSVVYTCQIQEKSGEMS
jgi:hypothetical protein